MINAPERSWLDPRVVARPSSAAVADGLNLLLGDDEVIVRGNHSCDSNLWLRDAVYRGHFSPFLNARIEDMDAER